MQETIGLEPTPHANIKTPAEKFESVAFTFCKAATIIAIAGRYALPIAAGSAAALYIAAFLKGKQDTRCILHLPLLIAGFWLSVLGFWIFAAINPAVSAFMPTWWR